MKTIILLLAFISSVVLNGQVTLVPYRVEEKWGVADFFERIIVEPKYEEVGFFSDPATSFPPGKPLASVKLNGVYGFIDQFGTEVIPPIYQSVTDFNQGYALVEKDGKRFAIDTAGNMVADSFYHPLELLPNYTIVTPLKMLTQVKESAWQQFFLDIGCEEVYRHEGDNVVFLVKKKGRCGIVQRGKLLVSMMYDSIHTYEGRSYVLYQNGKQAFCSGYGRPPQTVIIPEYDEIKMIHVNGNRKVLFRKNGLWGTMVRNNETIALRYKTLELCKERDFLYEVTTKEGRFGYFHPGLNVEFFADEQPLSLEDMKPYFAEAENYANNYIEQILADVDMDQLTMMVEECLNSMMDISTDDAQVLYRDFALGKVKRWHKIDTATLSKIAEIYLANEIVSRNAMKASPKLIAACAHLEIQFQSLIEQHPKYPFSQIVQTFKNNIVNEVSFHLINSATTPIFENCDFNKEFYQKIIILRNFYSLIFAHLVDKGSLEKPTKR